MDDFLESLQVDSPQPSINKRPPLRIPGVGRELIELLLFIFVVYTLVELAIPRFLVDGRSMEPNFYHDQRLVISRVNFMLGDIERGNIAVFNGPGYAPTSPPLIKRVIGLPGDTVEIRDTLTYVNGEQLAEPYINEPCRAAGRSCRDQIWELGENEYILFGDNRNHSTDSRSFGPVPKDLIIGEALFRFWPLDNIGSVKDIAYP